MRVLISLNLILVASVVILNFSVGKLINTANEILKYSQPEAIRLVEELPKLKGIEEVNE